MPVDSLPVQSGDRIETFKPGPGEPHVPSALLKALTAGGDLVSVRVGSDGSIAIESKGPAVDSAIKAGNRVAVGASSAQLCAANANRSYVLITNLEGPGDVWISFGGTAAEFAGLPIPLGGAWEIPAGVRWTGAINAIAIGGASHVSVVEF